jgi:aryl-alcohol dehydrogenase-like predicted oxidoreductase
MQYRTLGRTGIRVSPNALGALALGTSIGARGPAEPEPAPSARR